jgi:hypothetical protein
VVHRFPTSAGERIRGAEIPPGGHVEIEIDEAARTTRVTVVEPE